MAAPKTATVSELRQNLAQFLEGTGSGDGNEGIRMTRGGCGRRLGLSGRGRPRPYGGVGRVGLEPAAAVGG